LLNKAPCPCYPRVFWCYFCIHHFARYTSTTLDAICCLCDIQNGLMIDKLFRSRYAGTHRHQNGVSA
jgi:hypothetical protein